MNHEYYNSQIRSLRQQRRLFLDAVEQCQASIDNCVDDKLGALLRKLDSECYICMPEVTERDLAMDTYWDKQEQIEEVKDYMNGVEYQIRFQVMIAEAESLMGDLRASCPDPEVNELVHEWACEMADMERYEW
jgi:hypothetical protein